MDFLFKTYFVFFRGKGERTAAAAAAVGLSIPLGALAYLIFLFTISFVVDLAHLGGILFGLLGGLFVFLVGALLRRVYVIQERYRKLAPVKYPFFYGLFGVVFYFTSVFVFAILFVSILGVPQQG